MRLKVEEGASGISGVFSIDECSMTDDKRDRVSSSVKPIRVRMAVKGPRKCRDRRSERCGAQHLLGYA